MPRLLALLAVALACLAGPARAGAPKAPAGRPVTRDDEPLNEEQYRQGLEQLRAYLQKRDEHPLFVDRFIDELEERVRGRAGVVPVTRGSFAAFLKYEAAWARKTRDAKNPQVTARLLQHEQQRADELRELFNQDAQTCSPRFYAAFRAAVQEVRSTRGRRGEAYSGSSQVFFADQVNDAYTKLDAADEALDRGNATLAKRLAAAALAESPRNADALVMRAGASYAQGDSAAAIQDARAALELDPRSQQARALLELSGGAPTAAKSALADAQAIGGDIAAGATGAATPPADAAAAVSLAAAPSAARAVTGVPARLADAPAPLAAMPAFSAPLSPAPSATPALGLRLSSDLTLRAARRAQLDPNASLEELDRAIALDPRNVQALDWRSYVSNKQGRYRDALAAADRALAVRPRDARAYFNRAFALAGEGDKPAALDALRQAASFDPAYQPVLDQALQLSQASDMALLFRDHAPPARPAAGGGLADSLLHAPPTVLLAVIAGLLFLLVLSQFALLRRAQNN